MDFSRANCIGSSSDLEDEYKNAGIQGGDLIMSVVGAGSDIGKPDGFMVQFFREALPESGR